jgi:hypothetical protein
MADYRAQLVPGERGGVLCLARTQEQAQVVLEYVAGIIENGPILAKMVIRRAADNAAHCPGRTFKSEIRLLMDWTLLRMKSGDT